MNRHNFDHRWRSIINTKEEMDRKWRAFLREQEDMAMAQRAAVTSAPAAGPISDETQTTVNTEPASIHFYVGDSDTIMFVVMNYKLGTISEPYDTGIVYDFGSSYIWSSSNNIHDGGFMPIIFDAPNSRTHAFFVTANGVVVDHIFTGGGYQNAQLDQHLTFFIDYDPDGSPTYGTLKMFDGVNVTTLTLDGVTTLNWGFGTGSVTSDRVVLFDFNSVGDFYLVGMNGQNVQIHVSVPEARPTMSINWTHDYVCGALYDETDMNLYKRFKVWASDGTVLQDVDISGFNVDQLTSDNLYGADGRFCGVFVNSADSGVDYLIVHYDRTTNTVILDTHERGTNFPNISVYDTDLEKWNPSNAMKSNVLIIFYKNGNHPVANGFDSAEFFDVWCMHHDLQSFTKTSLVTADEIGYRLSTNQEEGAIYNGDPMFLFYDVDGETFGDVSVAAFTSAGFVDFTVSINPTDIDDSRSFDCLAPDHGFFWVELQTNPGNRDWFMVNSSGSAIVTHTTSTSTIDGGGPMYNALVVLDLNDYGNCFAFSPSRGLEILPDPSPDTYSVLGYNDIENEFGTSSGYSTRNVILETLEADKDNQVIGFRIYNNESGLQSYVQLPAYTVIQRFLMGESVVFFSYNDLENSYFSGALYDIQTGELLNISVVPLNENPNSNANYGDRIWNTLLIDGDNVIYFYSRSGMVSFNLGSEFISSAYNDAFWIND